MILAGRAREKGRVAPPAAAVFTHEGHTADPAKAAPGYATQHAPAAASRAVDTSVNARVEDHASSTLNRASSGTVGTRLLLVGSPAPAIVGRVSTCVGLAARTACCLLALVAASDAAVRAHERCLPMLVQAAAAAVHGSRGNNNSDGSGDISEVCTGTRLACHQCAGGKP